MKSKYWFPFVDILFFCDTIQSCFQNFHHLFSLEINITVILLEPGPINTQFRANALAAIKAHIDIEASDHKVQYQQQISRLTSEKSNAPFTLEPLAVTQALIHALESKRPKLRYRITTPTKLFAVLKRLLPTRWLDYFLAKG